MKLLVLVLVACSSPAPKLPPRFPDPEPEPAHAEPAADPEQPAGEPAAARPDRRRPRERRATEADIAFCHEETNRYRTLIKKPHFVRSPALDAFAAAGAEKDARKREPHHHFNSTEFPDSFSALAENELPWWHLDDDAGAIRRVIRAGLSSMWAEGPGGGHYENLVGSFTQMGCGISIRGDEITVVQDFRTP